MRAFNDARYKQGVRLARWMMFVDGEGLAIRGREFLHSRSLEPSAGALYVPDVFLWTPGAKPREVFPPIHSAPLEQFAIRWNYYTALQGDDVKQDSVRDKLHSLGFDPHVFKKNSKKSKGVDISLARDFLGHAYKDNFDAAVLVAGDADFVPLVEDVKRLGKQVFILFFPSLRIPVMPNTYSGRSRTSGDQRLTTLVGGYFVGFFPFVKAVLFRIDSPRSTSLCALWTSRSQIESATVASPMAACHWSMAS